MVYEGRTGFKLVCYWSAAGDIIVDAVTTTSELGRTKFAIRCDIDGVVKNRLRWPAIVTVVD
jgi:hypothetical protein